TTAGTNIPQQVPQLTDVVAVRGGTFHSLALGADGTVWAWGATATSPPGYGTSTPSGTTRPTLVPGISAMQAIGAGSLYSVALRSDGTVWAWGLSEGLGTGGGTSSVLPVQVPSLIGVESIDGGQNSVLAIQSGGLLWGWGYNDWGQLGNGTSGVVPSPVPAVDLTGVVGAGAGTYFGVAFTTDHSLWSWGLGSTGQLGDGEAGAIDPYRVKVASPPALNSPVALSVGEGSTLALNSDGTVWSWGSDINGALGNGTSGGGPSAYDVPAVIAGLSGITLVAAGGQNGFAVGSGGKVWGWGYNNQGNAGCSASASPVLSPTQLPTLTGITAIAAGYSGGVAVGAGGAVWTWGYNVSGQLGIGTTTGQSNFPVQIPGFTGVVAVGAGENFCIALKSDGTVWAWGDNSTGQMGGATAGTSQSSPIQVPGLSSIVAISAGFAHGMALGSDGTVWTWGDNSQGEIGNGVFTNTLSSAPPAPVPNLSGVVSICGGYSTSMAITSDHTLWAWGMNMEGQLAIGSTGVVNVPTLIIR
ncbi:MAG TPA: hypothetical protein VG457_15330, partial [Planctomycetota bacterium]|nr:hypothetical protein [Planctomycetota bacterium]